MADVFSKSERSSIMSKVKSCGNEATELRLIKIFDEFGICGWRRRVKVFGNPDFTFPATRLAIFVDGCFWHGCRKHGGVPETNRAFWLNKFARNKMRDRLVTRTLQESGWMVLRIWQHELRKPCKVANRVKQSLISQRSISK